jgi:hypothetical protein
VLLVGLRFVAEFSSLEVLVWSKKVTHSSKKKKKKKTNKQIQIKKKWDTELGVGQVDAFTDSAFKGNPAAVCLLEEERDEQWLQAVAAEFNISETCYLTRLTESGPLDSSIPRFRLRWFTPVAEVSSFTSTSFCFKVTGRKETSIFLGPKC